MSKRARIGRILQVSRRQVWRRRAAFLVVAASGCLGLVFVAGSHGIFLPGPTSDGHHLVQASCSSCHTPFGDELSRSCADCHRAELEADIHPARLFDDPRWASDLEQLDATDCVTCHREHRIAERGVTIDPQFCTLCHGSVQADRPSHRDFTAESCATGGCHNYHDGSALRADRLAKRLGEPGLLPGWGVPRRTPHPDLPHPERRARFAASTPVPPHDLPAPSPVLEAWQGSAHAPAEVGCSSCHLVEGAVALEPDRAVCGECHGFEAETFLTGKHGMRLRVGLQPLHPRDARLPMKSGAVRGVPHLDCGTCHDPHSVDTRQAATEACLGCHDDPHTKSFSDSPHARTVQDAPAGTPPRPREVFCATCHLPRVEIEGEDGPRIAVRHDNSLTLAPPDRMANMVCGACHGFELALTALVDEEQVRNNFRTPPEKRLKTFGMVESTARDEEGRNS